MRRLRARNKKEQQLVETVSSVCGQSAECTFKVAIRSKGFKCAIRKHIIAMDDAGRRFTFVTHAGCPPTQLVTESTLWKGGYAWDKDPCGCYTFARILVGEFGEYGDIPFNREASTVLAMLGELRRFRMWTKRHNNACSMVPMRESYAYRANYLVRCLIAKTERVGLRLPTAGASTYNDAEFSFYE